MTIPRAPRVRVHIVTRDVKMPKSEILFCFSYLVFRPEPGCNPRDTRRGTRHQTVSVASPGYPFLRVGIIPSLRRQERNHDARSREFIIEHRYTSRDTTINRHIHSARRSTADCARLRRVTSHGVAHSFASVSYPRRRRGHAIALRHAALPHSEPARLAAAALSHHRAPHSPSAYCATAHSFH